MGFILKILIALMLGFSALSASAEGVNVQIKDPWVLAAPPNVKVLAAYLEIINNGGKPRILINVSSPAFDQVGIHRSVMHENMAHMEHLKELTIPPHASVTLKPGGLHFMLMDAKKPLRVGDSQRSGGARRRRGRGICRGGLRDLARPARRSVRRLGPRPRNRAWRRDAPAMEKAARL